MDLSRAVDRIEGRVYKTLRRSFDEEDFEIRHYVDEEHIELRAFVDEEISIFEWSGRVMPIEDWAMEEVVPDRFVEINVFME